MADSLLVNTYRPEEGLMFVNVTGENANKELRYFHALTDFQGGVYVAIIDSSGKREDVFLPREATLRLRDELLKAFPREEPDAPRRLCDPAPTEPAPASCTSLLDGDGDWWVEDPETGRFFTVDPDIADGGEDLAVIDEDYGIDPGEQPEPSPVGAVVYVTGDEAETGHYHPVGAEVTVVPNDERQYTGDDFGFVLTADSEGLNQWIAEADLDISPPPGPYHIGAQVRLFNGETAIIVEDLGTQTDAFGRDHHFYTVAREGNPFPPGASTTPGAATFTADFIDGPTGDAPWTPWDVKRLVKNLAEESLGE